MRKIFSKSETKQLIKITRGLFQHYISLRDEKPIAEYIQFPKISSNFTEPLAFHLIQNGRILKKLRGHSLGLRKKGDADLILEDPKDKKSKFSIEVKATGNKYFSRLTGNDLKADCVVWISFGEFFINSRIKPIEVYVVPNLVNYIKKPGHITLKKFLEILGKKNKEIIKPIPIDLKKEGLY